MDVGVGRMGLPQRCAACERHVHDLSAMTERSARRLLRRSPDVCVRYTCRTDGTVVHTERRLGRTLVPRALAVVGAALAVWCWRLADDGKVLAGCSTTWSLCEQRSWTLANRFLDPAANARAQAALEPCTGVTEPWTAVGMQLFQVLRDEQTCLEFVGRPLPELRDTGCRPSTPEDLARLGENEQR
jgi:hypothetical protein